ncbi:MAG: inorganic phosphate transporter [Peptococcaceae bacterium]|nr:inorganic phosphate transporter [Peptococcaceae bacterium]
MPIDSSLAIIVIVVVLALFFDFSNGFQDTANAIATSISTRALTPKLAIILAAVMNFLGALAFTGVAKTIGGKIADPFALEHGMFIVMAALVAATAWNVITTYFGMPSSCSHALIGALAGAVVASVGVQGINIYGFGKIMLALLISPLAAVTAGFAFMWTIRKVFADANPFKINRRFRLIQVLTASFQAFSHGTNDAQKTMGIITFALIAGGFQSDLEIHLWVKVAAATAMALGTSVGGWRIIKTLGTQIIRLRPASGVSADLGSTTVILSATMLGAPVSTTHVISSSIFGTGIARQRAAVKWLTGRNMLVAWILTLPVSALLAGLCYRVLDAIVIS